MENQKQEHRLRSLLLSSGIVIKSEEIRFTPPAEEEKNTWEERTFQVRSTYIRTRERHGSVIKPPKPEHDNVKRELIVTPETNNSYKLRYWVKKSDLGNRLEAIMWNNKANELLNKGMYDEAVKCYDKAIAIDPNSSALWNNKGVALHDMGEADKALECYNKSIGIDSDNAIAWIGRGAVLHGLKKYNEALVCYNKAIEINPMLSDAWYNRGIILKKLGQKRKGEEDLKLAEKIDKED